MNKKQYSINDWCKNIVQWRKSKCFETNWMNTMEKLMLIVTEVSEAAEAYRHLDLECDTAFYTINKIPNESPALENFKEELADTFIRLADLAGSLNIDLQQAVIDKMIINKKRPYKHGKKC